MGYFLFFESMLDSVLHVANHYLTDQGHIFPRHYQLFIVGIHCTDEFRLRYLDHWSNVYGFAMPALRRAALSEAHVLNLSLTNESHSVDILTQSIQLMSLDLNNARHNSIETNSKLICSKEFDFVIDCTKLEQKSSTLDAVLGWFDVDFDRNAWNQVSWIIIHLERYYNFVSLINLLNLRI